MSSKIELHSLEEPVFDDISIYDIMTGPRIEPHTRISIFTPDDYEMFTNSWLYACRSDRYVNTTVYGKSGDKGRDVAGFYDDESWDNYQCKRYRNALNPSTIKLEVGKIIYYSFNGDYNAPKKHYFVSPKGITNNSKDLLNNSQELKTAMLQEWDDVCKTKITTTKEIPLTEELTAYINNFNFKIFKYVGSETMVNDLVGTKFYSHFFGGGFTMPRSSDSVFPPEEVDDSEAKYIRCLLDAYEDYHDNEIENLKTLEDSHPKEYKHFKKQRQYYYTAEALRKYSVESLPPQKPDVKTHFEKLKDEYHCVIGDIMDNDFDNGYECIKEVLVEVAKVPCGNSILKYEVGVKDKKGICHHLSNDGEVVWVSEDE